MKEKDVIKEILRSHFEFRPTGADCNPIAVYDTRTRDSAIAFYEQGKDFDSVDFWADHARAAAEKAEQAAGKGFGLRAFMGEYLDFVDAVRAYDHERRTRLEKRIVYPIARIRLENGLTQAQLAEKIGVLQQHVSAWETGRQIPTTRTLKKIAAALGVELETLIER